MFANLTDAIAHHGRRRGNHPALIEGSRTVTYAELASAVKRTAEHLRALGFGERDIVGNALGDTVDHVVVMLAMARMGAVMLPMDHRWTPVEKERITAYFAVKGVIAAADSPDIPGAKNHRTDDAWRKAVDAQSDTGTFPSDADAPLFLSMSSGTTGMPKGPMVTHRHMTLRMITQAISMTFNEHDRNMLATPMYFGGGRGYTLAHLLMGATVVMNPPPYTPEQLVQRVNEMDVTTLFLVPTLYRRLLALPDTGKLAFPKLRLLISSGSLLYPEERAQIMERLSPNFLNAYSSTEGGAVTLLMPFHQGDKAKSVGRPQYMNELQIVDENDQPVKPGEVGRIRQQAPWLPDGFYKNPEETKKAFKNGWYYPGDLGRVDEDGYLYLVGRAKDMIIRGGVNIYPAEIEETLLKHPAILDVAAVGWPSREMGEEIACFVVKRGEIDEAQILDILRENVARYKIPKQIFFLDDLPKNSMGKVVKPELVKRLTPIA